MNQNDAQNGDTVQQLRQERDAALAVLESVTDGIIAWDRNWRFTYVNAEGARILGRPATELRGQGVLELFPELQHTTFFPHYEAALRENRVTEVTDYYAQFDTHFQVRAFPHEHGLSLYLRDVSDRLRFEKAFRNSIEALRDSEEQYRTLFETAPFGVVYQDKDSQILSANPAAERILGLTLDQMQGRTSLDARWRAVKEDGSDFPGEAHPVPIALETGRVIRDVPMGIFHPGQNEYRWLRVTALPQFREGESIPYRCFALFEDVTEQHRAEAAVQKANSALRASEERYRLFTEVSPQIIWSSRSDGLINYCNLYWKEYTGLTAEETYAEGWARAVHPDDHERAVAAWRAAAQNGDSYEVEMRFRRASDGMYRWFLARGLPLREDSKITRWLGTALDIHDRREASESLRRSEARYRSLALASGAMIWQAHANGAVFGDVPGWQALTGQTPNEYHGWGWADAVHPEDREPTALLWNAAREKNRPLETMYRLRTRDGQYRRMLIRAVPVVEADGTANEWVGSVIDIEDALQAEESLRESESRFRDLAENIPQLAWMTDATGWIFWYNRRWFDYTGTTLEEMQGWKWQAVHHPDHVVRVTEKFANHVRGGDAWEDVFPIRGKDGQYRWFLSRAFPIRDEAGMVVRWFGTNTDITEQREAERQIAEFAQKQQRVAETLQRSLLLAPAEDVYPGFDVTTVYEPAWDEAQIAGDFYDVFAPAPGKAAFVVGDVTGKGLKAASYTAEVKFALRALLREDPYPASALARLNRSLALGQALDRPGENSVCVALTLAVVDLQTGEAQLVAAGAEPPLWIHGTNGHAEEVYTTGVLVGADPDSRYDTRIVTLERGDTLLLTTDGVTEARRGRRFFGYDGLLRTAETSARDGGNADGVGRAVVEAAKAFAGGKLQDDACLLVVRRQE